MKHDVENILRPTNMIIKKNMLDYPNNTIKNDSINMIPYPR